MTMKRSIPAVAALMAAAAVVPAVPAQAAPRLKYCYLSEATVRNSAGQNAARAEAGWCLDRANGHFETTTGANWVKDLVNGDGVAARVWVSGTYQDGSSFRKMRAVDYTTTSGATSWGFDGYISSVYIAVCLGTKPQSQSGSRCADLDPPAFWPNP